MVLFVCRDIKGSNTFVNQFNEGAMQGFKQTLSSQKAAVNPVQHFARLTKRELPAVMPHQKAILETYAESYESNTDVALQLPIGSGKTLVGLLIADWRRLKNEEKVVYLCPTRQLVKQTVQHAYDKYGIDVVDFSGSKESFLPEDKAAYITANKVAVSTFSGLFNTNPFFKDPDVIVVDDIHAAENSIAGLWSLRIDPSTALHTRLAEFLRKYIGAKEYDRLSGNWFDSSDANWVEKIPSPLLADIEDSIREIIDAHLGNLENAENKDLHFRWSMIRNHLHACQMYLASREILLRPLYPPSFDHPPFFNAKQRIFMSATMGAGGDLERLTGRKKITRLPAPKGFETLGVGRRFFILPLLSLSTEETSQLQKKIQMFAGRSVILTPSNHRADEICEVMNQTLPSWRLFRNKDIENDKKSFVMNSKSVAVLANRYDGIDFPKDECRLLCIDGLPQATNPQEMFLLSKMGARVLYDERIQTRVLQSTGRCTRALEDRSAVFVTDLQLTDYLINTKRAKHFPPTLQAELKFGLTQSTNSNSEDLFRYFQMFIENVTEWSIADSAISDDIGHCERRSYPYSEELGEAAAHEIDYQKAMWNQDFHEAFLAAKNVLSKLTHSELRGYRALWHYLAGSAYLRLSEQKNDKHSKIANDNFVQAKKAAPNVVWLNKLIRETLASPIDGMAEEFNSEVANQVEELEKNFVRLGTMTNHRYEKESREILKGLNDVQQFETAHRDLGSFLGFISGKGKGDAAPDCWWLGEKVGLVFEDHAGGKESTALGAHKALQAANHSKWLNANYEGTKTMTLHPIILSPSTKAQPGAIPQLEGVKYWKLDDFIDWATKSIASLRAIKETFSQEGDLVWRAEASGLLVYHNLTIERIVDSLPQAKEALK